MAGTSPAMTGRGRRGPCGTDERAFDWAFAAPMAYAGSVCPGGGGRKGCSIQAALAEAGQASLRDSPPPGLSSLMRWQTDLSPPGGGEASLALAATLA